MITYQRERAHELWNEIPPLLKDHWQEIAAFKDIPLNPNVESYCSLEDAGMLRCYTVRNNAELIGYSIFVVNFNPHYQDSLQANEDVIFVHPGHRKGRVGLMLIRYCEQELKKEGVQVLYHHAKAAHPKLGSILERCGYQLMDKIYAKRLDLEVH